VIVLIIMVTVMAVGMIVIMIMMIVMIVCDVEEFRLDFENTLQVEGVASEYRVERHRAVHGLVKFGIRLIARIRASTSSSSSGPTRSVLLRMITSAKAIWFLASGASFSRSASHLASRW